MSESEVDNSQKEAIESESIEAEIEEKPQDTATQQKAEQVVVKKNSFLSFLAFLLSISALVVSGYLFYLQQFMTKEANENQPWQTPLAAVDNKLTQQLTGFSRQLTTIKQSNEQLILQLEALQKKADTTTTSIEKFDDSLIKQQISVIESQLIEQNKRFTELQNDLTASSQQQSQSIQQFKKEMQSKQTALVNSEPQKIESNYAYDMAESLLQAAHIQLNINGNIAKAQELLTKTQQQLQQISTPESVKLANELQTVASGLNLDSLPDIVQLNRQIDNISMATAQLKFPQNLPTEKAPQNSSWYDKLITIRKIDDTRQPKLTTAEQYSIIATLKRHYEMLKIALMNKNQILWSTEIKQIEGLLHSHFAENAKDIMTQLSTLNAIDVNPVFPDLSTHLQKLENINMENNESH